MDAYADLTPVEQSAGDLSSNLRQHASKASKYHAGNKRAQKLLRQERGTAESRHASEDTRGSCSGGFCCLDHSHCYQAYQLQTSKKEVCRYLTQNALS